MIKIGKLKKKEEKKDKKVDGSDLQRAYNTIKHDQLPDYLPKTKNKKIITYLSQIQCALRI